MFFYYQNCLIQLSEFSLEHNNIFKTLYSKQKNVNLHLV